jgi:cyclohexanone monooxygenase
MRKQDFARIAPTPEAEEAWVEHANELTAGTLSAKGNFCFVEANIPGKKRVFLLYANTAPAYRQKCAEAAAKGYDGFLLQ